MKLKGSLISKTKCLLIGILVGAAILGPSVSYANTLISAWISDNITIYFDGQKKELPEGYQTLVYEGRTYVPARFIAEELGATVNWDDATRHIRIVSSKKDVDGLKAEIRELEGEIVKLEKKLEEQQAKEKQDVDGRDYRILPTSKTSADGKITITMIKIDDKETTVYLNFENRSQVPIQLNQSSAEIIVDGKTIKKTELTSVLSPFDARWYNDIKQDEEVDGWIKLPPIAEDTKKLTFKVSVLKNDGSQAKTTYEFDIKL